MFRTAIASRAALPRLSGHRAFHASVLRAIQVGDSVPTTTLFNGAEDSEVNLAETTARGKYLLVGLPGAFTTPCTQNHVPGFISQAGQLRDKGVEKVFVVSVNDTFVSKAWREQLLADNTGADEKFLSVLADPEGKFSGELDVLFDAPPKIGGKRSRRYAAVIEDGKFSKLFEESDSTQVDKSSADAVLGGI